MPLTPPLRTERLVLRSYRPGDADALLAYYADPDVARYLLDEPWTPDLARERVEQRLTQTGLDTESHALALVVEDRGTVVGDLTLWTTDGTGRLAEIGWVFSREHAGQGFATESTRALLDAAFGDLGLHRVEARMDARNVSSARLAERLGMVREGHLRQNWWSKGEWTDTLVFGLLAADFGRA